jgi:hypothetical protein
MYYGNHCNPGIHSSAKKTRKIGVMAANKQTSKADALQGAAKQDRLLGQLMTGAFTAMLVATPLLPSDTYSLAMEGQIAAPAMLWIVLAVCATVASLLRVSRSSGAKLSLTLADVAIGLFFFWVVIAGVIASADANRRAGWNMTASWLTLGLTYYLARLLLRDSASVRAVLVGVVGIAMVFSLEGIYESLVTIPANQAKFRRNPAALLAEAGIMSGPGSVAYEQFRSRLETQRPSATFALENTLAGFLAPAVIIGLALFLFGTKRERNEFGFFRRAVTVLVLIALAACIYLTHSTAAIASAGFAILIGTVALLFRDQKVVSIVMRYTAIAAMAILFLWPLAIGWLGAGYGERFPLTLKYRAEYWQSCAMIFQNNLIWGCSPGNFQDTYSQYMLPQAAETIADPHNWIWEVLCCSGAAAGGLLLVGLALAIRGPISSFLSPLQNEAEEIDPSKTPESIPISMRPLAIGAIAGVPLALLLSLSSSSNFLLQFLPTWLLLGVVPFAIYLWVLLPWIRDGEVSPQLCWLPWLGLAIHLTVSGGIGNPGTGTLFFLLLAMSQSLAPLKGQIGLKQVMPAGVALLVCLCVVGFSHYRWGYVPVLASQADVTRADIGLSVGDRDLAKRALAEATTSDPWSANPYARRALLELQSYQMDAQESQAQPDKLLAISSEAISRTRRSPTMRYEMGLILLQAHAISPKPDLLSEARDQLAKATELAPSKAVVWAYRAFADSQAGEEAMAQAAAAEALRLDSANPHTQYDLALEPCPVPGRSFSGWLKELAGQEP